MSIKDPGPTPRKSAKAGYSRMHCANCPDLGKRMGFIIVIFPEFSNKTKEALTCFMLILIMDTENHFRKNNLHFIITVVIVISNNLCHYEQLCYF